MSRVGISTACFYPDDTFSSFENVVAENVPVAEVFMNTLCELTPENLSRYRKLMEQTGTEIISFHPYSSAFESLMFFSECTARITDGIEMYKRFFDAASVLGAKYFVFHGERVTPTFSRGLSGKEIICESYGRLIETAKSFGLTFTQENVNNHRSHSAEFIKYLSQTVPELKFTFDLKQAYRAKQNFEEIVCAMGKKLVHVHINDFGEHECCLPFCGNANLTRLSEMLSELEYSGDYVLEVYKTCLTSKEELKNSLEKTKKLFCK